MKGKSEKGWGVKILLGTALVISIIGSAWQNWQMESGRLKGGRMGAGSTQAASLPVPGISAGAAILVESAADGADEARAEGGLEVLYEYNADKKMYPASTTKIMTALVVLEMCEEQNLKLDNEIIVPSGAEGVEGSSLYLKAGERVSLEKLMYGLMLQSGNDAAAALAIAMGGGEDEEAAMARFVERMNEKAAGLGCVNTHFTNPHGLHHEQHYTTARDLAKIAEAAMKKELFRQIVSVKEWGDFTNKNKTVFQYEGGNGIKIGFTKTSGRTLVASASRSGRQLIAVVLNDGNWFQDAYALMDYGFSR